MVTGNTAVVGTDNDTKVALKNCSPFRKCRTEINDTFSDEAEHINIAMPVCKLIEYLRGRNFGRKEIWWN